MKKVARDFGYKEWPFLCATSQPGSDTKLSPLALYCQMVLMVGQSTSDKQIRLYKVIYAGSGAIKTTTVKEELDFLSEMLLMF